MEDNLSSIWATTSVAIAILNELRGMLSGLSVLKYSILYVITYGGVHYLIVLGGAGLLLFNGEESGLSMLKYSILYIITYYLIVLGGAGLLLFNGELSGELMVKASRFL